MEGKLKITEQDINQFYSEETASLFQFITGTDQFGIGGEAGVEALARKAGMTKESKVLDVGSGIGGPARYLAGNYSCQVTGIELSTANFNYAVKKTKESGLDHLVSFIQGNALNMSFPDNSFDVVWGVDAWAHIDDKEKLIKECFRVLKKGGIIAFVDELQAGEMTEAEKEEAFLCQAVPYLETISGYVKLLEKAGFTILSSEDVSQEYTKYYYDWQDKMEAKKTEIIAQVGSESFNQMRDIFGIMLKYAENGKIGEGRFIAKK